MEQQPQRPAPSIVDDLSLAEVVLVQRLEVHAAAIVSQWLTYRSSEPLPTSALDEATRAIFRLLAACEEDQINRPIPPIIGIVQDSQIRVNPRKSVCLSLMDYLEEFFIEKPFVKPGVESDVLASLLVAYCSPWARSSSTQDRLVDFFTGYSSCSSLHQLMVAEAFEKVIPRFSTLHDMEMLEAPFHGLILWLFRWTHPAARVQIWPETRRGDYNAHFPLGSHLIKLVMMLADKPKGGCAWFLHN
ncbi:hypothetical protein HDZ31DRAFT_64898 [Schizophyllum fasciatum]